MYSGIIWAATSIGPKQLELECFVSVVAQTETHEHLMLALGLDQTCDSTHDSLMRHSTMLTILDPVYHHRVSLYVTGLCCRNSVQVAVRNTVSAKRTKQYHGRG